MSDEPTREEPVVFAGSDGRGTRITVSGPAMPAGLTVRPEGVASAIRGARGVREVEIGHDSFDAASWVEGSPALARAVLHAGARQSLRALFDGRLERPGHSAFFASGRLEDGVLRVDVLEAPPPRRGEGAAAGQEPGASVYFIGPEHLGEAVTLAIGIARRLATPADVPARLAENLKSEPVAGVRLQLVATLLREFADHEATRPALLAAREDPDADVRLRAGIALGAEGRDVLLAIAGGEGAPDETTERAVAALGLHLTTPEAEAILRNALRTRREATARACLDALGQQRGPQVVPTLAKVLAVEKPWLAAAARALGRVGTVAAVQPLKDLEARDRPCRAAARQAIAEVQARLKGARPGQLSLAGGESGQLSLAEGERGRLSLAAQPPGPLRPARGIRRTDG